jgi:hypothetical protein
LDLLERQPERFGYVGLAHVEHKPAHPSAAADMLVYGINFGDHLCRHVIRAIWVLHSQDAVTRCGCK